MARAIPEVLVQPRAVYAITPKGREVLHGPAAWALSSHTRDLLTLCDPQLSVQQARQFLPPESLKAALFSLCELGLIEGPPVRLQTPAPRGWFGLTALRTETALLSSPR